MSIESEGEILFNSSMLFFFVEFVNITKTCFLRSRLPTKITFYLWGKRLLQTIAANITRLQDTKTWGALLSVSKLIIKHTTDSLWTIKLILIVVQVSCPSPFCQAVTYYQNEIGEFSHCFDERFPLRTFRRLALTLSLFFSWET